MIFPVRLISQLWGYDLTMYSCESWTIRKAECQRIDAFEQWCWRRLLRSKVSLDSKEIRLVNIKGNQPWILVGRTDAKAQTQEFWLSELTHWKSPWCWARLREEAEEASEDGMDGWHHWCNGHELGQTSGDFEGQRGLACYSPWSRKESDTTEQLNNINDILVQWSQVFSLVAKSCL